MAPEDIDVKASNENDICLIILLGSEFAMKGINALNFLGVKYTTYSLSIMDLTKRLGPPHEVPVLCYDQEVIPDSTNIIKFLDGKALAPFKLFPNSDTKEYEFVTSVEDEIDSVLSPYLRYYSLYDRQGFDRCLGPQIKSLIPWGFKWTAEILLYNTRVEMKEVLKYAVPELDVECPVEVRNGLNALMAKYESYLPDSETKVPDGDSKISPGEAKPFICGTDYPSAADAGLMGMLQRLVGRSGDADFPPCLPDLLDPFPKLQAYVARMNRAYPVEFFGDKRRDKNAPRPSGIIA